MFKLRLQNKLSLKRIGQR